MAIAAAYYQFRKANLADVPALVALINKAYRGESSARGWTTESHLLGGTRTDVQSLATDMSLPGAQVITCSNALGQFIGCTYTKPDTDALYLGMLTVDPDLQANGIGKMLLAEAEKEAALLGLPKMRITVITLRTELITWYKRRGYAATGQVDAFTYAQPFNLTNQPLFLQVMEKALSP